MAPFDNEAGFTVTLKEPGVPGWTTNEVVGDSVNHPTPQLVVRMDGDNVTELPVLLVIDTGAVWDTPPALTLKVSEAGFADTPVSEPIFMLTDTCTADPLLGKMVMIPV